MDMKALSNLRENPLFRAYLKIFSADALVKGAGILLLPVYLRLMSQDEIGLFGYVTAAIAAFSLVMNVGLYAAQSKLYHEIDESQRGSLYFTLVALLLSVVVPSIMLAVVTGADKWVASFLVHESIDYASYRFPVLASVVVAVGSTMIVNFFLTTEQFSRVQRFNVLRAALIHIAVLIVLWLFPTDDQANSRIVVAMIAEGLILIFFLRYYFQSMRLVFSADLARRALAVSAPVLVSALLGLIINLSDRFFIERYGSLRELSIYNVAMTLAGAIPFVFASFQNVWLPHYLKERDASESFEKSGRMIVRITAGLLLVSVGIIALMAILLWTNIIDQRYAETLPLLPIVLAAAVSTAITGMYSNQLIYLGRLGVIVWMSVLLAGLGIALNTWLVPEFHMYGAAIVNLIVNLLFLLSYRMAGSHYYRSAIRVKSK